jgi:hypothetical protein
VPTHSVSTMHPHLHPQLAPVHSSCMGRSANALPRWTGGQELPPPLTQPPRLRAEKPRDQTHSGQSVGHPASLIMHRQLITSAAYILQANTSHFGDRDGREGYYIEDTGSMSLYKQHAPRNVKKIYLKKKTCGKDKRNEHKVMDERTRDFKRDK